MKNLMIVLLIFFMTSSVYADSKPSVQLIFRIDDALYKKFFEDKLGELESSVQKQLCPIFNKYLSFMSFKSNPADDKFIISLHNIFKNTQDFSTPKDLVFFFDFKGPNVKDDIHQLHWNFQGKSKYGEEPFSAQDFSSSIVSVIEFNLRTKYEMMVESVFSNYILTKDAHLISQMKGWALPFNSDSMRIDTGTQFEIEVEKDTEFGAATCEYFTTIRIHKIPPEAQVPEKFKGCFIVTNTLEKDDCSVFATDNRTSQVKEVTLRIFNRKEQQEDSSVPPDRFVPDSN